MQKDPAKTYLAGSFFDSLADYGRDDCPGEYLPGEQGLSDQAQGDVGSLTKKVVLPRSNSLVLEGLVESEGVEEPRDELFQQE